MSDAPPAGGVAARSTFIHGLVPHVSGMAFDPDGYLYAALRTAKQVLRFDADGSSSVTFIDALPDDPEFIRYVPDST
ncbi:MAG TPA: hypothetical protein VNA20_17960 [Frankiaceae bacterium]|nr:hypothetical protein [Frankiaceae bacterium]